MRARGGSRGIFSLTQDGGGGPEVGGGGELDKRHGAKEESERGERAIPPSPHFHQRAAWQGASPPPPATGITLARLTPAPLPLRNSDVRCPRCTSTSSAFPPRSV